MTTTEVRTQRDLAKYIDDVLENVAWAETGAEVAKQITEEFGWRPPVDVITGTPSDVVAALEALPDGAIVRVSDEAKADRECAVFVAVQGFGGRTWEGSGVHGTFATSYLANNCTPLTVIG